MMTYYQGPDGSKSSTLPIRWFDLGSLRSVPDPHAALHLWSFSLGDDCDAALTKECLVEREIIRANEFVTKDLRTRFVRAHAGLRCVLGMYLGLPPRKVSLASLLGGKPCLVDEELHFNLSHTDTRALVAVSAGGPVGVDLEDVRLTPNCMSLARRWFSHDEVCWIGSEDNIDRAFLRCWVRREAFLKSIGVGLAMPLNTFSLTPPPEQAVVRSEKWNVRVHELLPDRHWVGAVAVCF
ncbi:MAG: 4'-phosphopantetheinyl transferase superfamily protein [Pseudodesulfovibrio sp.]|nr:4'-phosphopantetheinyl transferase superfamily protein [Pseudodesulfovibrio sp.]